MKYPNIAAACIFAFASTLPLESFANLRAPTIGLHAGAATVFPAQESLTVLGEELTFHFHLSREGVPSASLCNVHAKYRISASEQTVVELEFIGPVAADLHWQTDGQSGTVKLTHVSGPETSPDELAITSSDGPVDLPVYSATFEVTLEPGENQLNLIYKQPTSYFEMDYGYMRSSKFVHWVDYHIWPISEWQLAEEFSLEVSVSIDDPVKSAWARLRNRDDRTWISDSESKRIAAKDQSKQSSSSWHFTAENLPEAIRVHTAPSSIEHRSIPFDTERLSPLAQ